MVRRLAGSMGATLALPGLALGHPVHNHLATFLLAETDTTAAATDWKPKFLDPTQNELFTVLAELIVPGSAPAQVNRIVDLVLTVETPANQRMFVDSLSAVDRESHHRFGHAFKSLAAAQQIELLTVASTQPPNRTPKSKQSTPNLRDHFENLKGWIAGAYYSTETGMRELGWTEEHYFDFEGCEHEEEHR
jgi:hypothetical protein